MISPPSIDSAVERRVREVGEQLFAAMEAAPAPGIFSKKGAYARMMEWALQDAAFKTQLFRFVDVLPALRSNAEVVRHLQEYLGDKAVALSPALKVGLAASSFAPALVAGPVKANIASMARQFVAGATPEDLVRQLERNAQLGLATTIDLLGETVLSEAEADAFLRRNLDVLGTVAAALARNPEPAFSDRGPSGPLPRLNLSVKISALAPELPVADPKHALAGLKPRLREILRRAAAVGGFINFDMESYALKDLTLSLFRSIVAEPEFQTQPAIGIALQAYLRDTDHDLTQLIRWARERNRPITVRLVKGAYWDYETTLAEQRGWPVPVWSHKAETDAAFESLTVRLLEANDLVTPAFATHNVRSCAHAIAQAERLGVEQRAYEFQALYGMADELKRALVAAGYRVREYCAIGELLPGMAYLVRRLLENTSNEGFLRQRNLGEASKEQLLANPRERIANRPSVVDTPPSARSGTTGENGAARTITRNETAPSLGHDLLPDNVPFRNEPNTDFSREAARQRQRTALDRAMRALGQTWPLRLNGEVVGERELVPSINPAHPAQVVGTWGRATLADADAAVAAARAAFPRWRDTPTAERAALLERVADLLAAQRFELNALEVLEAGKPWLEADADVSEAIDFCRYYATEMRTLDRPLVTQRVPGERCMQRWTPRGVGVVIAPWNFPLAILCGLTVAPLVAGNCVIMKPAEQTSVLAARLMAVFAAAGIPAGVVNLLTGFGEDVGAHLVSHRGIDFVAFTGSRAVGLKIWETAARTPPGQANLKKVVCEMGGKNALIIDDDADFDEAIPATLYSAFGFSGQKCSALSRLILLPESHDDFVARLVAAARSLRLGDPAEPATVVGPVIDADAERRILERIEVGRHEATLAWQATVPAALGATGGYYVPPTIFTDVRADSMLAQEEIFGPVLAVLKARDLDDAFRLANASEYALTGGVFSRSPSTLARAEREFQVGNLYLNRGITGAIVQRHPFGGFKLSGGGTKAGGRGYLENFLFPRAIAENVLRRGFTPEEAGE